MKTLTLGLMIFFLLLACQNSGLSRQEERSAVADQKKVTTMDIQGSADGGKPMSRPWQNFKKPSDAVLKQKLAPLQYKVTQREEQSRLFKMNTTPTSGKASMSISSPVSRFSVPKTSMIQELDGQVLPSPWYRKISSPMKTGVCSRFAPK